MDKSEVAAILEEIAVLLELQGENPFRANAYAKAGRTIAQLETNLDDVVKAGVKIIFNYTEALLHVPSDVTVHTTSPAVELLYALYFYLT